VVSCEAGVKKDIFSGRVIMKRVVLIGDSIRKGYERTVKLALRREARVWAPEENCGPSYRIYENIEEWIVAEEPDIVHINCGLHDTRRDLNAKKPWVPIETYKTNLKKIFGKIRERAGAKIIWATTTPVNEEWHHKMKGFERLESRIVEYNDAAVKVAESFGASIDDLFKVVMDAGRDKILSPDGVHYSEKGFELLGKAVAESIRAQL
jgi:lysophospholipase L1-like esterase